MKKIIALLLAFVMICSLFAGCGHKTPNEETTPSNPPVAGEDDPPVSTDAPKDVKNVDIYPLEGEHTLTTAVIIENPYESHFLGIFEEATGVTMDYQIVTKEQIPLIVAGGESTMPDLIFATLSTSGLSIDQINEYGYAGAIINYADYLDQMPNLSAAIAADPLLISAVSDINGNFYTLPQDVFTLTSAGTMMYMRADHLAEAGWDKAPTNIDEFVQCLRDLEATFGAKDPDYIAFAPYQASHMKYSGNLTKALFPTFGDLLEPGLTITRDQSTVTAGFASEQYKRYVTFMNGLYEEGLLDPNCFTSTGDFMKGFINDGHNTVSSLLVYMQPEHFPSGKNEVIIPAPLTSEYNPTSTWLMPNRYTPWCGLISSDCEDLDAALAFVDALYATPDNPIDDEGTVFGTCLWLGKYGRDWAWIEEGVSYAQLFPEEYASRSEYDAGKGFGTAPFIGYFPYVLVDAAGNAAMKPVQVQANLIPNVVENMYVSALKLTEDEYDIYVDAWADIDTYVTQMHASFITGEIDIETGWEDFLNTLDQMGLQDILEVYQTALDRYNNK